MAFAPVTYHIGPYENACKLKKSILKMPFKMANLNNTITILQERLERMNSATALETALPRKVLLEQLSRILPADDSLPEQVGSI